MLGAIFGDIVGSVYEWNNIKSTQFPLYDSEAFFTDDSVMTIAVAKALSEANLSNETEVKQQTIQWMRKIGKHYPDSGYGGHFFQWMFDESMGPYNSFGNGSAMRVSSAGWYASSLSQSLNLAKWVSEVTHNHPEGIKGAQATAAAIYLAKTKHSKKQIKEYIEDHFYSLPVSCDVIRPTYQFNETCQKTVPEAIVAFLDSTDFEHAIRLAISLGGDSDTLAAITGSIAEAFYGMSPSNKEYALSKLDDRLKTIAIDFAQRK